MLLEDTHGNGHPLPIFQHIKAHTAENDTKTMMNVRADALANAGHDVPPPSTPSLVGPTPLKVCGPG